MSNGMKGDESARPAQSLSPDLSHHIKGCYCLIKLVIDDGLGDPGKLNATTQGTRLTRPTVPKTIVDQESIKRYIDLVSPGSYQSASRVRLLSKMKLALTGDTDRLRGTGQAYHETHSRLRKYQLSCDLFAKPW
jgi:hypothetical protein